MLEMIGRVDVQPLGRDSSRYAPVIHGGWVAAAPALETAGTHVGSARSVVTRISSPVFIGRLAERAELERAWALTQAGVGQIRLVYGEAGIGKSRLLTQVLDEIGESGSVLRGRCLDVGEAGLPFGPLAEVFRALWPELATGDDLDLRATIGPLLPADPVRPSAEPFNPALGRTRLFAAVAETLGRAARRRPRLLAIEDAHWLDPASRDLLRFLGHALRETAVLIVITVREEDLAPSTPTTRMLAELAREPHAARIDLDRFSLAEVADQLAAIIGHAPEPELVAAVYQRSDGNPFYTEEVVALDIATGTDVPPSLRDLVLSHLSRIGETGRRLLDAAAVGGRWVSDERLATVVGLRPSVYRAAERAAVSASFLVTEERPGGTGLAFRHALVRDAVYSDLLPSERRALHAAWAEALADDPAAVGSIAEHLDLAGRSEAAMAAYMTAGRAAEMRLAFASAQRLYERALAIGQRIDAATELELLERIAINAEAAGDRGAALAACERVALHPALGSDAGRAMRLLRMEAQLTVMSGAVDRSARALERALEFAAIARDDPEAAEVLATLALHRLLAGELEPARAAALEAVERAQATSNLSAELHAEQVLVLLRVDEMPDEGVAALADHARKAAAWGRSDVELHAALDLGWALVSAGRYAEVLDATSHARSMARALGTEGMITSTILNYELEALHALGRWNDVETILPGVERLERGAFARILGARHRYEQGRSDDAARLASAGLDRLPAGLDHPAYRGFRAEGEAILALARGEPLAAATRLDAAGSLPGQEYLESDLRLLAIRVRAAERLDDAGRDVLRRALERFRDLAHGPGASGARPTALRLAVAEAEVAAVLGPGDVDAWASAAGAAATVEHRPLLAYCRYREAEALLTGGGDRRAAEAALREAHGIAVQLGAAPLQAEIEALARRARLRLDTATEPATEPPTASAPTPADPHGLTEREREVLALLVAGRTNREIGAALFISPKTAGVHVSNILGKLGAVNRVEAAAIAHRLRLIGG